MAILPYEVLHRLLFPQAAIETYSHSSLVPLQHDPLRIVSRIGSSSWFFKQLTPTNNALIASQGLMCPQRLVLRPIWLLVHMDMSSEARPKGEHLRELRRQHQNCNLARSLARA